MSLHYLHIIPYIHETMCRMFPFHSLNSVALVLMFGCLFYTPWQEYNSLVVSTMNEYAECFCYLVAMGDACYYSGVIALGDVPNAVHFAVVYLLCTWRVNN